MKFVFEKEKLTELMRDFYTLTRIRLVLFDSDFKRVAAYPENECEFCRKIKESTKGQELCAKSDKEAFERCLRVQSSFEIYKCHAGLIEAVSPLKMNDIVIGYIMFGQIVEKSDKRTNKDKITEYLSEYTDNDTAEAERLFTSLISKSDTQISAAAKIMESCACYLCVSELFKVDEGELIFHLDNYINNNIAEDLTAEHLCRRFGISKNKLYALSASIYGTGIADYIRKKKVAIAGKYLKQGFSVADSAEKAGFSDYNYFSKIFKRETGVLPSKYGKE